jgi:hypothetical protein
MPNELQKGETPAETQVVEATEVKNTPEATADVTEEFDKDRAMDTIRKLRDVEKQYKQEKKELERLKADEARRKEAEMSETEKLKARADRLEAELTQERSERLRLKVASKYNLDALASRLKGETEEELEADAQELAKLLPTKTEEKKQPQLKATDIANGQNGKTDAQRRAEIYNRGASPFDTANAKANGGGVFFTEK